MNNYKILTQSSPWFLILCILLGMGYAFLLYQKKSPWNKNTNYILAGCRFLLVTILAYLLLGPIIQYFKNYSEKPILVFAIDHSQSIPYGADSTSLAKVKQDLNEVNKKLQDASIETSIQLYDKTLPSDSLTLLSFKHPSSNLNGLLGDIQSAYENRNLAGVVLLSDGIYNQGSDPTFARYAYPVHTIGIGDTLPKLDVNLKSLISNKLSYKNNQFPIRAELYANGYSGKSTQVILKKGNQQLASQTVTFPANQSMQTVEFYTSSAETGMQHYVVEVKPLANEFTLRNNVGHAYIDIIENKEKILIIAPSPHPDIRALRAAIEKKENYEVRLYIPGISEYKEDKYDLVIAHQLPDYAGTARVLMDKWQKENQSILYILGNQTNLNQFNNTNSVLSINSRQAQKDLVTPFYNSDFVRFNFDSENQSILNNFPPLIVPYGEYTLKGSSDILIHQKIGNTISSRPLVISSSDRKQSVIAGEGLWQWRQHEYMETQDNKAFDTFVTNLIQYLSAKEDKRKFRVYPISNEFLLSDQVLFETEIYNDVFEKIYGQKIDLKITDEEGKTTSYSYANGESNSKFEVKGLKQGVFKYTATAQIGGKAERYEGRFTIKELLIEALNTTADFNLLRQLAQKNNGIFVTSKNIQSLTAALLANPPASLLHSNEELVELINLPWLFFLLLGLASVEWFVRKYKGGY